MSGLLSKWSKIERRLLRQGWMGYAALQTLYIGVGVMTAGLPQLIRLEYMRRKGTLLG